MAITPTAALSAGAMWAFVSLSVIVEAQEGLTPCQRCCMPGGDCSKAFKGTPGKCCGTISGRSFCCPGAAGLGGAKCYNCGTAYRCFTGHSARNVCGNQGSFARMKPSEDRLLSGGNGGEVFIIFVIVAIGLVLYCSRTRPQFEEYGPPMGCHAASSAYKTPVANGVPLTSSGMAMPAAHAYPHQMPACAPYGGCCGYAQPAGYSGTAMAGSAAAGFMGGMLVSDMMHHHHQDHEVHHHYHEDGYGGLGGGGFGGGYSDASGGDDGGFEADS